ncbi:MAG: alpha/beta hydrolase [Cyclobacteriaceae bacterium]|nr:alpha/beta hydrolase [Cyclobacteriaceae bacterium]
MNESINYKITGKGIPFVFQHGLGAELGQAQSIFAGLNGIQLISMDCPGHGKSSYNISEPPSFRQYTDDLVGVLDKEKIHQAVFGGISMGSALSVQMALRFPEKVKGLVLVRPAWLDYGTPENLEILLEVADYIEQGKGADEFELTDSYQEMKKILPLAAASVMGLFSRDQLVDTPKVLRNMVNDVPFPSLDSLNSINVPTLIIVNHDDPLHPLKFGEIYASKIPNSQLNEVTSRYIDNDKHTREVRNLVGDFLTRVKPN